MAKGGRGKGFGPKGFYGRGQQMGGMGMPRDNSSELNELTSWNTVHSGVNTVRQMGRRLTQEWENFQGVHQDNLAWKQQRNYGRFMGGIGAFRGQLGGSIGRDVTSFINTLRSQIASAGGRNISQADLTKYLSGFKDKIDRYASLGGLMKTDGMQLKGLSDVVSKAITEAAKGGFGAMGGSGRDAIKAAFGAKEMGMADSAVAKTKDDIKKTLVAMSDPAFKKAIQDVQVEFTKVAAAARTASEKEKAVADASQKLGAIGISARGSGSKDKDIIQNLAKNTESQVQELRKGRRDVQIQKALGKGRDVVESAKRGFGSFIRAAPMVWRSLSQAVAGFQYANQYVNRFARLQMGVSAERGGFGRQIRGAGIRFQDMPGALAAGRSAGMSDAQVVNQMVHLQGQLAQARWGEGDLIKNAGRWGISVFDANGGMKSSTNLMMEYSRKLRSLSSTDEKLQFLQHIGFSPEQMEYVANYEKMAKRSQYLQQHQDQMGVLDRANYLDATGYNAKVDAATKVELRRREVLNQNAIEEGPWAAIKRSMHPENWLFKDWTARKAGVENAKQEMALERLSEELRANRKSLTENTAATKENTFTDVTLDAQSLQGLSLSGEWARREVAEKGAMSSAHHLREAYAKTFNIESESHKERRQTGWATGAGLLAGGLVAGGVLATGGLGLIPLLLAGLAGGAAGAGAFFGVKNMDFNTGMEKNVEKLRKMKSGADIEKKLREMGLTGVTAEHIMNEDFQKDMGKAKSILSGGYTNTQVIEAQKLTDKTIDPELALKFAEDKYFQARARTKMQAGEAVTENDIREAIVRRAGGEENYGVDKQLAYEYAMNGFDENSTSNKLEINREIARLRKEDKGKRTWDEYKKEATENKRQEFLDNMSDEDREMAKQQAQEIIKTGKSASTFKKHMTQWNALSDLDKERYGNATQFHRSEAIHEAKEQLEALEKSEKRTEKERAKQKEEEKKAKERRDKQAKEKEAVAANGLHDEPTYTAEQKKEHEAALRSGRESTLNYLKNRKKRPLAETSDLKQIANFRKKGMSEKELVARFGRDRFNQYMEEVNKGNIYDGKMAQSRNLRSVMMGFQKAMGANDMDKKGKRVTREAFEKQRRETLESIYGTDEKGKARVEEILKGNMAAYDDKTKYLEAKEKAQRAKAAKGAGKNKGRKRLVPDPSGSGMMIEVDGDAAKSLADKGAQTDALVNTASKAEAAEMAAASAKNANGGGGGDIDKSNNVTMNGGINITNNFNVDGVPDANDLRNANDQTADVLTKKLTTEFCASLNATNPNIGTH